MLGLVGLGLGVIGVVVLVLVGSVAPPPPPATPPAGGPLPFVLYSEVTGDGGADLRDRIDRGMADGISLHPPLGPVESGLAADPDIPLVYFAVPDGAGIGDCYPDSSDPRAPETLGELGRDTARAPTWRLVLPEFDQSGGCWARGRPDLAGLDDADAVAAWTAHYLDTLGLRDALGAAPGGSGQRTLALCVYGFCPRFAYDMGVDGVLLERNIDELGDLGPGIAMTRGAARQHGNRPWGVDLSTYRFWTDGPTEYGPGGVLRSGWSAATFERHLFLSWAAGAQMIHNEPADYTTGAVTDGLNPLGLTVREFGRFARANPAPVEPVVTTAVLADHDSGYEPRFGEFEQAERKWYGASPWSAGDRALDRILGAAFPGHERWGTVGREPWVVRDAGGEIDVARTRDGFRAALAAGLDPRTVEPTGTTSRGHSVDVLTDRADTATLERYDVVVVATSGPVDAALADRLDAFVRAGGRLVMAAEQVSGPAGALTGVRGGAGAIAGTSATPDPAGGATTRHVVGRGTVHLVAAEHYLTGDGALDPAAARLLDRLQQEAAPVQVDGPPTVQYAVSRSAGRTLVTIAGTGTEWRGTVRAPGGTPVDLRSGAPVAGRGADGGTLVEVTVPPYGVRVLAFGPTAG